MKLGSRDKISPLDLIGMTNDFTEKKNIEIGKIEIYKSFTFFEVEEKHSDLVIRSFQKAKLKGKNVIIEKAGPKNDSKRNDKDKDFRKKRSRDESDEQRTRKKRSRDESDEQRTRKKRSRDESDETRVRKERSRNESEEQQPRKKKEKNRKKYSSHKDKK